MANPPSWDSYWKVEELRSRSPLRPDTIDRIDVYRALDRLGKQLSVTLPKQLDRTRTFRNRFAKAVAL